MSFINKMIKEYSEGYWLECTCGVVIRSDSKKGLILGATKNNWIVTHKIIICPECAKKRHCVYCDKELTDPYWNIDGLLCEEHWFGFRYGSIKDDDPKFKIVEKEYLKS